VAGLGNWPVFVLFFLLEAVAFTLAVSCLSGDLSVASSAPNLVVGYLIGPLNAIVHTLQTLEQT